MGRYMPQNKEKASHPMIRPLYKAERQLERVLAWLQKLALLEILGIIGNVGIIIAVLTYIGTEKQRRDAEVLNAWQTITNASGQAGSGRTDTGFRVSQRFPWCKLAEEVSLDLCADVFVCVAC